MTDRTDKDFHDLTILCIQCEKPFVFTAGEQRFYHSKGLALPKRCPPCRLLRRIDLAKGVNHNG